MLDRFVNEDLPTLHKMRVCSLHFIGAGRSMARFIRAAREHFRLTPDALEAASNERIERRIMRGLRSLWSGECRRFSRACQAGRAL